MMWYDVGYVMTLIRGLMRQLHSAQADSADLRQLIRVLDSEFSGKQELQQKSKSGKFRVCKSMMLIFISMLEISY